MLAAGLGWKTHVCSNVVNAETGTGQLNAPGLVPEYFGQIDPGVDQKMLKAGFAEKDITPKPGMQMAGDYLPEFIKGFHDPCKVRAAVLDDGTTCVALVGIDTLVAPRSAVEAARGRIHDRCGIAPNAVMVGASHNHSGGPIGIIQGSDFANAPEFVKHLAYNESQIADPDYVDHVMEQIVSAVSEAYESRVEALCGAATGIEDKVAFTRRFRMRNGLTYTHPGQGNPEIEGPSGPADPQLVVIGAWNKDGRLLGCIVNYTCHNTTNPGSGDEASANWVYYMERVIRGSMGADVPVVFLQGAAGNVTQVDNLSPYMYPQRTEWAEFVGGRIGAEAVKVLLTMVPGSLVPLKAQSIVLNIQRRSPTQQHVREAYDLVKQDKDSVGHTRWIFAKETVLLDYLVRTCPKVPVEIQAIQVGPAIFLSNPAELFCQAGLDIKRGSHFPLTAVVSYANGAVGYVPTSEDFGPHGGGYETRLTSYSNLQVAASEEIVKSSLLLISRMSPGAAPAPRRVGRFSSGASGSIGAVPWSYGDVPPEVN